MQTNLSEWWFQLQSGYMFQSFIETYNACIFRISNLVHMDA